MNHFPGRWKCAAQAAAVQVLLALILFTAGCGSSSNNNNNNNPPPGTGNFSNASLNGHFAYTMRGYGLQPGSATVADYFVEGGVFTADGNGHITAGTDDFVQSGIPFSDPITGTYTINNDGTGELFLNVPGGTTQFRITLTDTSHFYLQEDDTFRTSSGSAQKQDSTLLSTMPAGTFVVRTHDSGVQSRVPIATMSRLALSGGNVSGSFFMLDAGSTLSGSVSSGTVGLPLNSDGRGTLNYTLNGTTFSFFYYQLSSSKFLLLETTTNAVSIGQAESQSAVTFSNSSLSGSYAFGSSGETDVPEGIHTAGMFTVDGAGNVSGGVTDSILDGVVSANVPVSSGNYTINADGSGSLFLGSEQRELWMVSPSRAFFIAVNGGNVEDGTMDKQSGAFSNSSFNAQSGFFMDGFDGTFKDRVGILQANGGGVINTSYLTSFFDPNLGGGTNPNSFAGTYSVASNGRVTSTFNGFTSGIVFYLVSNNTGYLVQADTGVDIGGAFAQQTGP